MSIRPVTKTCMQSDCNTTVARGQLGDDDMVREIRLHGSVTSVELLSQGMDIGSWLNAKVTHVSKDGKVTHAI
ncbi:MAG TPA: hypothetical protein VLG36_03975 [Candidatus Chromulinivoraceae bacterium]|nr:hypothetical protein [Candidatus Chromulinivoraceae bacterium]